MTTSHILNSIVHSLFRKPRKNENFIKYILYIVHIWLGLLTGVILSFMCLTGATYVFKAEVENFSARHMLKRDAPSVVDASPSLVMANYMEVYEALPGSIEIPENKARNMRVIAAGRGGATTFVDRETGEVLGELSPKVSNFFGTVMRLHRWFNMKRDTMHIGKAITGAVSLLFLFLLVSGIVLWWPKSKKKNPFKNKFNVRFKYKFNVWNRDLHINLGAIVALCLMVIVWTGLNFAYDWVRVLTVDTFNPDAVKKEAGAPQKRRQRGGNVNEEAILQLNWDKLLAETHSKLEYDGDLTIKLSGRGVSSPTVRKENKHNLLGAELFDDVVFSNQGLLVSVNPFVDKATHEKISSLIYPIHTGSILGLKSKILYFLLCLIAAYLPISGYIMWWKRLSLKR